MSTESDSVTIRELCFVYNDLPLSQKAKKMIIQQNLDRIDLEKYPGKRLLSWTKLNLNIKNEDLALEILECIWEHRREKITDLINQEIEFSNNNKKRGVTVNNILLNAVQCSWNKIIDFFCKNDLIDFLKNDYPFKYDYFKFVCQFGNENTVLKILNYGIDKIDFNSLNEENENAIIVACRNKLEKVAIKILPKINNLNQLTTKEDTLLHYVASNGFNDLFDLIKDNINLDFNLANDDLSTALLLAILNQKNYIAFEILKHNVNLLHQNKLGYSALHYALYRKNRTLCNTLIDMEPRIVTLINQKKDLNTFFLTISNQFFDVLDKMFNHLDIINEEFINMEDSKNLNLLESLILMKKSDLAIKLLESNKCKTFKETIDNIPKLNAFVYACHLNDEKVTMKILELRNKNNQEVDDLLLEKEFAFSCYNKLFETSNLYLQNQRLKFNYEFNDTDIEARLFDIICQNGWENMAIEIYGRMNLNYIFDFFEFNQKNNTILSSICEFNMENLLNLLKNLLPEKINSQIEFKKWNSHYTYCLNILKKNNIKNKNIENIINLKLINILKFEKERLVHEQKLKEKEKQDIIIKQQELLKEIEEEEKAKKQQKAIKKANKKKKEKNILVNNSKSSNQNRIVEVSIIQQDKIESNNDLIDNEIKDKLEDKIENIINQEQIFKLKEIEKEIHEVFKINSIDSFYFKLIPIQCKFDGKYWY